jgi:MFS family permease
MWLAGTVRIEQPFMSEAPWPYPDVGFAPLGYRPSPDHAHIVPTYAPGLSLLMAAAKALAGQCALFAVVPLMTGIFVFATYAIGRAIGRPIVGLAAAWLVATSPAMLFMAMWPMSDVPAAALWAVAVWLLLFETRRASAAAGLIASIAILIRPNLVPIAAVLALWIAWRDLTTNRWRERRACAPFFAVAASLGAIGVAVVYAQWYGSPLHSGYGNLSEKFATRWIPRNFTLYGGWLLTIETPLAALGLASLLLPLRALWPTPRARTALPLFAGCGVVVWASYIAYVTFREWWYLRFFLPAWPMMAIGSASMLAALCRRFDTASMKAIAIAIVVLVGAHGIRTAVQRNVFGLATDEAEYVEAARAVDAYAEPDAVIISREFSGSTRYYAGRLTVRFDFVDPAWLDRAVDWLNARGHHCYFLLNIEEIAWLRREFSPKSRFARLDWAPVALVRAGDARLFDSLPRPAASEPAMLPTGGPVRCLTPRPQPSFRTMGSLLQSVDTLVRVIPSRRCSILFSPKSSGHKTNEN